MARIIVEPDSDTAGILLSKRELWLLMHYFNYVGLNVHCALKNGLSDTVPQARNVESLKTLGVSLRGSYPDWKNLSNG